MGMTFKSLTFGGVNSLNFGIYITGDAVYNAPERDVEVFSIAGRNGDLTIDRGRFSNIEVTYPAGCFSYTQAEFASKIRAFRNAIVSKIGYQRLTDGYNEGEYRQALYTSGLDVSPTWNSRAGEFDITFNCKPQRFLTSGEETTTLTASGTITNPTEFASKPLIAVTGLGDLTVGSFEMSITGEAGQTLYIDCDTMEAYLNDGGTISPANTYLTITGTRYPELVSGANAITLGSGITKVEITPRWWRV